MLMALEVARSLGEWIREHEVWDPEEAWLGSAIGLWLQDEGILAVGGSYKLFLETVTIYLGRVMRGTEIPTARVRSTGAVVRLQTNDDEIWAYQLSEDVFDAVKYRYQQKELLAALAKNLKL